MMKRGKTPKSVSVKNDKMKSSLDHLSYFENIDRINRVILSENDLERMMNKVLDETLSIFDCERAFLLYPCDPDAGFWRVPMERTRPGYDSLGISGIDIPMDEEIAESFRLLLHSDGVVTFGKGGAQPLPPKGSKRYGFKAVMQVALYPKADKAWAFGVQQCSYERVWTFQEQQLLLEISRRLADGLGAMLAFQRLQESETRYRTFIETSNEGVMNVDSDQRINFINKRMCEMLGYPSEEILGYPLNGLLFEEDIPVHLEKMRLWQKGNVKSYERRFRKKNGEALWTLLSGTSLFDADGHYVGTYAMFADITRRKQMEEQLRTSEERFRLALEAAHIGLWDWDIKHDRFFLSSTYYTMLGYEPESGSGNREEWLARVHTDDRHLVVENIQKILSRQADRYTYDARLLHADGRYRWQRVVGFSMETDSGGEVTRMLGLRMDIDDQKRAEEELHRYKDHLEETIEQRTSELLLARDAAEAANRAKSQFLANMSHELRTPLNAILGFSQLMQQEGSLSPSQHENLNIINRSGAHLLGLINDVLEIAKIEAGRVQLERVPFSLGGMIHDVGEMMQLRAKQKGLFLKIDQSSQFPQFIKGDEARLRQIVINLVGNAIKFTRRGGVTIRLRTENITEQHLLIEVEDTGPGIGLQDQERLFRPFVQLAEGVAQNGTGLGLSIVKQYAEMMGGKVSLESRVGIGALFRVELPLEPAEAEDVKHTLERSHDNIAGLQPGQPAYKILIAEDQYENQMLLLHLMRTLGLETKIAENGQKCVELFEQWRPDLIWMDRRMPVMDGVEAARRIRGLPGGKNVKIIAVTASAFKEQQPELIKAGMDDFILKPYAFSEIYDCLSRHLGLKFFYGNDETAVEVNADQVLSAEMLAVVPETLRRQLREALLSLDPAAIASVITTIGSVDGELAGLLTRITDYFDYPRILDALDTLNGNDESGSGESA